MLLVFKAAWQYRHFVWSSIKSELRGKYANSGLGGAWMILHPLAQAAVLAVVLSQLLGARLSGIDSDYAYAIYLLAGVVGWNLFAETSAAAISMFRDRANLLKKVNFPRVCIPMIVVGTALLNHVIFLVVVILLTWALGLQPSTSLALLGVAVLVNLALALGFGLVLSIFDAFNRDIGHFWSVVTQLWFWLTPIVYSRDVLPASLETLMVYNPAYSVVSLYQKAIAFQQLDFDTGLFLPISVAALLLIIGFFLFIRASSDIVDAL